MKRAELQQRWDQQAIACIRRVLDCHALGADVIALKDAKHERLNALHALESLSRIEQRLSETFEDDLALR
jgi:hypothetical protein